MKVYPYNIALSFCFYPSLTEGQILEGLVASALNVGKYWRKNKREIDFLMVNQEIIPIEVKEKERVELNDLKNLIWFMDKHKLSHGILVYQGREDVFKTGNKKIILYPSLKLLFDSKIKTQRRE